MITKCRLWRLGSVLMVGAALTAAQSAAAQFGGSSDQLPVAPTSLVDEVSVDMTSGRRMDVYAVLAIGAKEDPSLVYTASYKPYGTELGGEIRTICVPGQYSQCQSSYLTYNMGSRVEYSADGVNLTDGSVSAYDTASQSYNVYDPSGRHWVFARYPYQGNDRPTHYLTEIREPNGRRLVYGYAAFSSNLITTMKNVVSISSTDGFQLNQVNDGNAVLTNRRFINCPLNSSSCPAADAEWPRITYAPASGGGLDVIVSGGPNFKLYNGVNYDSGNFIRYSEESAVCPSFVTGYVGISGSQGQTPQYCSRVRKVETPRGAWTYSYSGGRMTVTDPGGAAYSSDVSSSEVLITDQLSRLTRYKYVGSTFRTGDYYRYINQRIAEITLPEGNKQVFSYDSRFNVTKVVKHAKPGSGLSTQTWSAGYPASCTVSNFRICNKPEYLVDANNGRTDYTYDTAHGGTLTETLPADIGGLRGIRRHGYQQFSANYLDAAGNPVSGPPIWKRVWTKDCRSAVNCAGTAEEVISTFDYNENLLLRSITVTADGVTRRTCYGYDRTGNRISETRPKAGLASCS